MNLFIHGIRKKFRNPMKPLENAMLERGLDVAEVDYGYILIPVTNKLAVTALCKMLDRIPPNTRIVVIGYSNGAWAAIQAAEIGYRIDHLVMISPALHVKHAIPETTGRVSVFYSDGDVATLAGKYYRAFINIFPWRWKTPHQFGAMGKFGYLGNDSRVTNIKMPDYVRHTFYKHPLIVNQIVNHIKEVSCGKN